MKNKQESKINPVVAGAVLVGAAAAAVVLSKKENRDKAGKILKDVSKKGKLLAKDPHVKKIAATATGVAATAIAGSRK